MDRRCARTHGEMANAVDAADRLLRLPTWLGPIEHVEEFIARIAPRCGSLERAHASAFRAATLASLVLYAALCALIIVTAVAGLAG